MVRGWRIAGRPIGRALDAKDFTWFEATPAPLDPGHVRVRPVYLSCDPAQKGWMENAGGYASPTEIGDIMPATGVGQVLESRVDGLGQGDWVQGPLGWCSEAVVSARALERVEEAPDMLRARVGVLGTTGLTAYFGLERIARPFPGDTVVITGAAGGVGSIAGQIARLSGCRVIGFAGSLEKCRWLTDELGFDAAINYRTDDVRARLRQAAPDGIDVLWDNVGGPLLDVLLARIAMNARVVICGGIARYEQNRAPGPSNYFNLVFRRATMQGFILGDYKEAFAPARARLRAWLVSGALRHREDVAVGLENAPATLMRLFRGDNIGKLVLQP